MRPPKWTRDEVILAVDVFNKNKRQTSDSEYQALSDLLKSLPLIASDTRTDCFRNYFGVRRQLLALELTKRKNSKDPHVGEIFYIVAEIFEDKQDELHKIANAIKRCLPMVKHYTFGSIEETRGFQYGAILGHLHRNLEKKHGKAILKNAERCELCGIHPHSIYNLVNEAILETHWLVEPSDYDEGVVPQKKDMLVVCPNCHSALHQAYPWIDKNQLTTIFLDN